MVMRHPPVLLTNPEITASRAMLLASHLGVRHGEGDSVLMQLVLRVPSIFSVPQVCLQAVCAWRGACARA